MFNRKNVAALERRVAALESCLNTHIGICQELTRKLNRMADEFEPTRRGGNMTFADARDAVPGILGHLGLALQRRQPWEQNVTVVPIPDPDLKFGPGRMAPRSDAPGEGTKP